MKKVLLVLVMVVLTFSMSAQEAVADSVYVSNVDIFTDSPIKQPKLQVTKVVDSERRIVVPVHGKTADEIYTMVEIAVAKFWKNPDEVIEGKSAGKYIKIRGGGSTVQFNSLGLIYSFSTISSYMIQFKDGKFMYTISYETKYPVTQYSNGGIYPTILKTHKKNGKPIKLAISNMASINAGVNSFINTILESDLESGVDSDW